MNPEQADVLGKRIVNIWRSSPPLPEWHRKLLPLDYETTCLALAELRDHQDGALSIAQFHAVYRRHVTDDRIPTKCAQCEGTGWTEADPYEALEHIYSAVRPCRCSKGRQAEIVVDRIHGRTDAA